MKDVTLGWEDVYLYGAWVEEVALDTSELRLTFGYPPAAPNYQEVWPHINVARGTLVFAMRPGARAMPKDPNRSVHQQTFFPTARDFARRFEDSDAAWSRLSVARYETGGFMISVRQAQDFHIDAERCEVVDSIPVERETGDWIQTDDLPREPPYSLFPGQFPNF